MNIVVTLRMLRAAQKFKCFYCRNETILKNTSGRPTQDNHATYEHLMPRSEGGGNEPSNLCCACNLCNTLRGTKNLTWFMGYMNKIRMDSKLIIRWHQLPENERKAIFAACEVEYQNWLREREMVMAQALRR